MNQFQSFDEVLSAMRRRARLMVAIIILGCAASAYFALNQERLYQATAVVQVEDPAVREEPVGTAAAVEDAGRQIRLLEQRLMARDNILRLIEEFDVFADAPDMPLDLQVFQMREAARLEQIINGAQAWQPNVTPSGIYITVTLPDPEKAAGVANALLQDVIDLSRERNLSAAEQALSFYSAEEARVREQIVALETRIADFKRANADSLPESQTSARSQI
ncbi:MAG: chain-length determining protein, partial [Alphaproteobacteria bacterium]|nr:chain-length determining protein [Alphaproteobacteria bacterium]